MPPWIVRARVLEKWAATEPGTTDEEGLLTPKQESEAIREAMIQRDTEFFAPYGGRGPAMKRAYELREVARERSERRDRDRKRAQELAPGNLPSADFQRGRLRKRPVSAAL